MENLKTLNSEELIYTSLELVEMINAERVAEGEATGKVRKMLKHKTFLVKIEKEFDSEITEQKILPSYYTDDSGKSNKLYNLNNYQSMEISMTESKFVRKAVIARLKHLEEENQKLRQHSMNMIDPIQAMQMVVDKMTNDNHKIIELENNLANLRLEIEAIKALPEPNTHNTIIGYAKKVGVSLKGVNTSVIGRKASRLSRERDVEIRKVEDDRWLEVNSYENEILDEVFSQYNLQN